MPITKKVTPVCLPPSNVLRARLEHLSKASDPFVKPMLYHFLLLLAVAHALQTPQHYSQPVGHAVFLFLGSPLPLSFFCLTLTLTLTSTLGSAAPQTRSQPEITVTVTQG